MRKWTKTAGLLFLAAASVYSIEVIVASADRRAMPLSAAIAPARAAAPAKAPAAVAKTPARPSRIYGAETSTEVKILDESNDPFANASTATTQPAAAPTTQSTEGRSVSSSEVSVSDAGTVEIHVNDANLVEVLRMLSLQSQKNIVASKEVHGTVTANLYDVTVREALDAILHANGYAYREKGNFVYVYTTKEIAEIEKAEKVMKTEVFRVFYTPAADAATMIKPVLSKGGGEVAVTTPAKAGISSAPGGGGGDSFSNNDVLVITDYPENIDAVRKLLAEIDRRPQQILLEATILRATLNEDNALGVDFNIMGGVDMAGVVGGGTQITNSAALGPVPADPLTPRAAIGDGGLTPQGRVHSAGTGNAFTSPISGGLKVGYVTDSISLFLSALEQTTDTTILANPKVLALNKQQGEVFVGNEDGYYTTLTTETTTSQSVESLKTGTRLIFRPFVGNDGYIRMEVHPEDSDGQVKANGLPSKSTTEVTSNIMVKDGHTIVIGGLFRESTITGKSQVPFLGNLPIAGLLFKNQRDRTVREEVIILLTPHIVKDDAAYSRLSEEDLKHAEDLRVGLRKGMMPWGRERLAQGWYEAARREMSKTKPNRGIATWELDCATNLNPKFTDAIQLKEQITGHVVSEVDTSTIRSFVRRAMLRDMAPTTAPMAEAPASQPVEQATAQGPEPVEIKDPEIDAQSPTAMTGTAEASTDEAVSLPDLPVPAPAPVVPATQPVAPDAPAAPVATQPADSIATEPAVTIATQPAAPTAPQAAELSDDEAENHPANPPFESVEIVNTPQVAPATQAVKDESAATQPVQETQPTVTVVPLDEEPVEQK